MKDKKMKEEKQHWNAKNKEEKMKKNEKEKMEKKRENMKEEEKLEDEGGGRIRRWRKRIRVRRIR